VRAWVKDRVGNGGSRAEPLDIGDLERIWGALKLRGIVSEELAKEDDLSFGVALTMAILVSVCSVAAAEATSTPAGRILTDVAGARICRMETGFVFLNNCFSTRYKLNRRVGGLTHEICRVGGLRGCISESGMGWNNTTRFWVCGGVHHAPNKFTLLLSFQVGVLGKVTEGPKALGLETEGQELGHRRECILEGSVDAGEVVLKIVREAVEVQKWQGETPGGDVGVRGTEKAIGLW
jgi:hypothetical protein